MARVNQAAFDVGRLSQRLAEGYYLYSAMLHLSRHPEAKTLAPVIEAGHPGPVGRVFRKDGSSHVYDFTHYLGWARNNRLIDDDLNQVWIVGALIQVGEALDQNDYFDHAPELELVRHLRNAVAHGNRFKITAPITDPAHNKFAQVRSTDFEITQALHRKPALFDFMWPADCLDLLMSVGLYLCRMGDGLPLRP